MWPRLLLSLDDLPFLSRSISSTLSSSSFPPTNEVLFFQFGPNLARRREKNICLSHGMETAINLEMEGIREVCKLKRRIIRRSARGERATFLPLPWRCCSACL